MKKINIIKHFNVLQEEKQLQKEKEYKPRLKSGGFKRSLGPSEFEQESRDGSDKKGKEYVVPKYDFKKMEIPKPTVVDIDEVKLFFKTKLTKKIKKANNAVVIR